MTLLYFLSLIFFLHSNCCAACHSFYQIIVVFVPGGAAVLALIVLLTLAPQKIGQRPGRRIGKQQNYEIEVGFCAGENIVTLRYFRVLVFL